VYRPANLRLVLQYQQIRLTRVTRDSQWDTLSANGLKLLRGVFECLPRVEGKLGNRDDVADTETETHGQINVLVNSCLRDCVVFVGLSD
jgi:hypothetical protein